MLRKHIQALPASNPLLQQVKHIFKTIITKFASQGVVELNLQSQRPSRSRLTMFALTKDDE